MLYSINFAGDTALIHAINRLYKYTKKAKQRKQEKREKEKDFMDMVPNLLEAGINVSITDR